MASGLRALRRRILTPNVSAVRLENRGFHVKSQAAKELLETVGETFLTGYAYAVEARNATEAAERLEQIPTQFRGFAYEGAGMGMAIMDGLPFGNGRVAEFLRGPGDPHVYIVYVGVGWAMARLPRFLWSRLHAPDPLLRWLVLDGYGFHQAFFHTRKYVHEQYRDERFPWPPDAPQYAGRAIDQGVGRAMWFVGGTDAELVCDMIDRFPAHRRPDLYAGAGLAATYAGGSDADELQTLWDRAGEHRLQVAQGSVFAATCRVRAGLTVPHTRLATRVLCGMSPEEAARLSDDAIPGASATSEAPGDAQVPQFEIWRRSIADAAAVHAGGASR